MKFIGIVSFAGLCFFAGMLFRYHIEGPGPKNMFAVPKPYDERLGFDSVQIVDPWKSKEVNFCYYHDYNKGSKNYHYKFENGKWDTNFNWKADSTRWRKVLGGWRFISYLDTVQFITWRIRIDSTTPK